MVLMTRITAVTLYTGPGTHHGPYDMDSLQLHYIGPNMVLMTCIHHSYIVHRTQHGPFDMDSPQLYCTQDPTWSF